MLFVMTQKVSQKFMDETILDFELRKIFSSFLNRISLVFQTVTLTHYFLFDMTQLQFKIKGFEIRFLEHLEGLL